MIRVGLIGYGYWGSNLLRNLINNRAFEVVAVADTSESRRVEVCRHPVAVRSLETAEAVIALPEIDAVVIATPVATHYEIARLALEEGKHVLVEKPMCASSDEAQDLLQLAKARNRVLMVDHTFLFTGAVQYVHTIVDRGDLGRIAYVDAMRVNLGPFQRDVNVLWDLGPHDLSIVDHILGEEPIHIEASGYCHANSCQADMAYLTLHYTSRIVAHLNLGWISPVKVRRFAVGGSAKTLVWDDLSSQEKLKIYTAEPDPQSQEDRSVLLAEYRSGDILSPRVPTCEALAGVIEHFAKVIAGQQESIMDGRSGLRIIRMLEAAQRALDESLAHVHRLGANSVRAVGS
jgi:predicted dehydrogenase